MAKNGNKRRMVSRPSSSAQAAERPGILFQLAGLDSAYSDLLRTVFEHMAEEEKKRLAADERFCERVQTLDFFRNGNPDEPLLQEFLSFTRLGRPSVRYLEPMAAMAV